MIEIHYYKIYKGRKVRKLYVTSTQGEASAKAKFERWFKKMFSKSSFEIISII